MVGVPGKYKGCNTCRSRRVKCGNERPFCKKCTDSGRECQGYERETTFIVSTIEDSGRCSSHPPRILKGSKKAKSPTNESEKFELTPVEPLRPAWDDLISLSSSGKTYPIQIAALHTKLHTIFRTGEEGDGDRFSFMALPPYQPASSHPTLGNNDFKLRSQCMVDLSPAAEYDTTTTDSILMFLYEHNYSVSSSNLAPWRDPQVQANRIRQLGPEYFTTFPAHHFFVRVYRHNAICTALLNRKSTFLADPEWIIVPWEHHPKLAFDQLFDIIALLPSILCRTDHCLPHDPTLARRLMAQDLLGNCLNLQAQFQQWNNSVLETSDAQSQLFWFREQDGAGISPFDETYAFRDSVTALTFIHFWTSLIVFYPCIEQLQLAIFQPVLDAFPQVYPDLPPNLPIDMERYSVKEVREIAANVCRSLDFALSTVQPDMLAVPIYVVEQFYNSLSMATGDGNLELMWLGGFKQRMVVRGQDIADVVQSRKWIDVAEY